MQRFWLIGLMTAAVAATAFFTLTRPVAAQNTAPSGKLAVINVVNAFNEYQRQKDLADEISQLEQRLQQEDQSRKQRLEQKQAELDRINQEDPTYNERAREMLTMTIDYKNWRDVKQADMTREIGLWSAKCYREIRDAAGAVAKERGLDLVLFAEEFRPESFDPQAIRAAIEKVEVIYANPSIDLTQAVTEKLNADYRALPKQTMLQVP